MFARIHQDMSSVYPLRGLIGWRFAGFLLRGSRLDSYFLDWFFDDFLPAAAGGEEEDKYRRNSTKTHVFSTAGGRQTNAAYSTMCE